MAFGFGFGLPYQAAASGGPTLNLNFLGSTALDPRITFTRSSAATYTNSAGLVTSAATNIPRFDYDPVTLQPKGLLIEEQRTNLLTYSSEFDNAAWTKADSTVAGNVVTAPDGTTNADKLQENATTAEHYVLYNSAPLSSGARNTISLFAKSAERTYCTVFATNKDAASVRVRFNLTDGTSAVLTTGANLTVNTSASLGNGWWRLSITIDGGTGATVPQIVFETDTGSAFNYAGTAGYGIYLWGAQLEAGAFATSYIPTTSAQVTRAADNAVMTGTNFSSWFNQAAGTFYAETIDCQFSAVNFNPVVQSDNGSNTGNRYLLYFNGATTARFYTEPSAVGPSATISGLVNLIKLSGAYDGTNVVAAFNGTAQAQVAYTVPATQTRLQIGGLIAGAALNGHLRAITYYPRRLSNAELQAITS